MSLRNLARTWAQPCSCAGVVAIVALQLAVPHIAAVCCGELLACPLLKYLVRWLLLACRGELAACLTSAALVCWCFPDVCVAAAAWARRWRMSKSVAALEVLLVSLISPKAPDCNS
ncbi:hypothetical protein COO60DRAFT_217233 [Scenedesmus sp. NREL 46B-D3]|nr:hypothetical protein COO60DRAFT_217233 [Scenedesmus sp. NREL 46B-D3]